MYLRRHGTTVGIYCSAVNPETKQIPRENDVRNFSSVIERWSVEDNLDG